MSTLLIKNGVIVTEEKTLTADILIVDGKIIKIEKDLNDYADQVIDAKENYIFPGGVDAHTHMQLPVMGTTSSDDFSSGTRAALFGGTTTIIDFANQVRGESLRKTVDDWYQKAQGKVYCDYALHLSVTDVNPQTIAELPKIIRDDGITSFKTFLAYDAMKLTKEKLKELMIEVKKLGAMVTSHSENGKMVDAMIAKNLAEGNTAPKYHPLSRPWTAESDATATMMQLAEETGCLTYIVHMTCAGAVNHLKKAKEKNLPVLGETCTQYLMLDETLYQKDDFNQACRYVMSPPLRSRPDRDALWRAVRSGDIKVVATDHCPFMIEQKRAGIHNFTKIPNGAPGVEDRLEVLYSEGVNNRLIDLQTFVKVTSTNPAKIFGLYPKKGTLAVGSDADLYILDPNQVHQKSATSHHMNVDYNCYEGLVLKGKIEQVVVGGELAIDRGNFLLNKKSGSYLKRNLPSYI